MKYLPRLVCSNNLTVISLYSRGNVTSFYGGGRGGGTEGVEIIDFSAFSSDDIYESDNPRSRSSIYGIAASGVQRFRGMQRRIHNTIVAGGSC